MKLDIDGIIKLATMIADNKKEKPMTRRRAPRNFKHISEANAIELMRKRLDEAEDLKRFLEEREKINKKEDKKKDGWSVEKIAIFLVLSFPITGVLYLKLISSLMGK